MAAFSRGRQTTQSSCQNLAVFRNNTTTPRQAGSSDIDSLYFNLPSTHIIYTLKVLIARRTASHFGPTLTISRTGRNYDVPVLNCICTLFFATAGDTDGGRLACSWLIRVLLL